MIIVRHPERSQINIDPIFTAVRDATSNCASNFAPKAYYLRPYMLFHTPKKITYVFKSNPIEYVRENGKVVDMGKYLFPFWFGYIFKMCHEGHKIFCLR